MHETQAYGVLATTEKALGSINGINRPDPAFGATGTVPPINEFQHLVGVFDRSTQLLLGLVVFKLGSLDQLPYRILQRLVLAQLCSFFFSYDFILGEVVF